MKALTLIQPWSWAIAHAGKRVENRTWAPPASVIGQRVAIHAGKKLDDDGCITVGLRLMGQPLDLPNDDAFVHGAVESVATISIAVHFSEGYDIIANHGVTEGELDAAFASPWRVPGMWSWVLTDVVALPKPVLCRGAQGLWILPEDVERAVLAQVGGGHG